MNAVHANDVQHSLLQSHENRDMIVVRRSDLETEHRQLLSRLQQLRRLLGYDPLPTGKQQRLAAAK